MRSALPSPPPQPPKPPPTPGHSLTKNPLPQRPPIVTARPAQTPIGPDPSPCYRRSGTSRPARASGSRYLPFYQSKPAAQPKFSLMTLAPRQPSRKAGEQPPTAAIARPTDRQISDSKSLSRNWHCSADAGRPHGAHRPMQQMQRTATRHRKNGARNSHANSPDTWRQACCEANPILRAPSDVTISKCQTLSHRLPRNLGLFDQRSARTKMHKNAQCAFAASPQLSAIRPQPGNAAGEPMQQTQRTATRHRRNGARNSRAKNPDAWRQHMLRSEPNPTCSTGPRSRDRRPIGVYRRSSAAPWFFRNERTQSNTTL